MAGRSFYNEILTEHNLHPEHKHDLPDANLVLDLGVGRKREDALHLAGIFLRMIQGPAEKDELEELEEACALQDISHMPARVKCAVLGWHTMEELLSEKNG